MLHTFKSIRFEDVRVYQDKSGELWFICIDLLKGFGYNESLTGGSYNAFILDIKDENIKVFDRVKFENHYNIKINVESKAIRLINMKGFEKIKFSSKKHLKNQINDFKCWIRREVKHLYQNEDNVKLNVNQSMTMKGKYMLHTFTNKLYGDIRAYEDGENKLWFICTDLMRVMKLNQNPTTGLYNSFVGRVDESDIKTFSKVEFNEHCKTLPKANVRYVKLISAEGFSKMKNNQKKSLEISIKDFKDWVSLLSVKSKNYKYKTMSTPFNLENPNKDSVDKNNGIVDEHKEQIIQKREKIILRDYMNTYTLMDRLGMKELKLFTYLHNMNLIYIYKGEWTLYDSAIKKGFAIYKNNEILWTKKGRVLIFQNLKELV